MDLKEQFQKAVADSKLLPEKPDNDTLLKIYALYKQATDGDLTADPPTNPFDIVAKAKYQAWAALKGMTKDKAMSDYVQLVHQLGAK